MCSTNFLSLPGALKHSFHVTHNRPNHLRLLHRLLSHWFILRRRGWRRLLLLWHCVHLCRCWLRDCACFVHVWIRFDLVSSHGVFSRERELLQVSLRECQTALLLVGFCHMCRWSIRGSRDNLGRENWRACLLLEWQWRWGCWKLFRC